MTDMTEVVYCGCKGKYQKRNRVHHIETKKHKEWIYNQDIIEQLACVAEEKNYESIDCIEFDPFLDESDLKEENGAKGLEQFNFGVPNDTKRIFIDFIEKTIVITTEGANGPTSLKLCIQCDALVV